MPHSIVRPITRLCCKWMEAKDSQALVASSILVTRLQETPANSGGAGTGSESRSAHWSASSAKRCSICTETLPIDAFNRDRTKGDGRQSICRSCSKSNYSRGSNREKHLERGRAYRQNNRLARRAQKKIECAIKRGDMVRGFCECCGTEKADAHHWKGYDHPLDVQWLCRSCHVAIEPRRGAA